MFVVKGDMIHAQYKISGPKMMVYVKVIDTSFEAQVSGLQFADIGRYA